MAQNLDTTEQSRPRVGAGGLVTVAYLKAQLDTGADHLGIFMPLVLDVLPGLANRYFTAAEVQEALAATHGVSMPQQAVVTLLRRAAGKQIVVRDAGRFRLSDSIALPRTTVSGDKALLEVAHMRLAEALRNHATRRGLDLPTNDAALNLLLRFIDEQQVALLLGVPPAEEDVPTLSQRESSVLAEFLHDVVGSDLAFSGILAGILEGLVLYHAAFLPDIPGASRNFSDLTAVFDTVLVRQALGYEGTIPQILVRETIDLLGRSGVRCVVLDKTVQEIQRILSMYQDKLATSEGRHSLRPVPMTRHFLTQRYSPSDVREMSALLDQQIGSAGLRIISAPAHVARFTHGEAKLAERLADPKTRDVTQPRVLHDVDCVAAVLTLRRGHRPSKVEDAKYLFVTTAWLVLRNTRQWWEEDEGEYGIAPIVHIRALANLAWLKKPVTNGDFQVRELVALCAAAMRPSQRLWQRFLTHLDELQTSQRLSADQATAIIVSAVSDRALRDVEVDEDDPDDVDAGTLDEVVDRVISQYRADGDRRVDETVRAYEQRMAETIAEASERTARAEREAGEGTARARQEAIESIEELRRRDLVTKVRAHRWARRIANGVFWLVVATVVIGAAAIAFREPFGEGWVGVALGLAVFMFILLETLGVLGHLRAMRGAIDTWLQGRLYAWLSAGQEPQALGDHRDPDSES